MSAVKYFDRTFILSLSKRFYLENLKTDSARELELAGRSLSVAVFMRVE